MKSAEPHSAIWKRKGFLNTSFFIILILALKQMNFVNVAPNGNESAMISDNLIYTEVSTNGTATGAEVNIVPSTWLTSGATANLTSGVSNVMVELDNTPAGTYQTNFSATFRGTGFGTTDVIDFEWVGTKTAVPVGQTDSLVVCKSNYSTARSLGTFNSTDTFVLPVVDNLKLYARFTGSATGVSVTVYPYLSIYKIA